MASQWNDKKWARVLTSLILLGLFAYGAYLRYHDLGVSLYDDEINTRERAMQSVTHTIQTRPYPSPSTAWYATSTPGPPGWWPQHWLPSIPFT